MQAVPPPFGTIGGVHLSNVSTRTHSPFRNTVPGGHLVFTHSLPSSTVPGGHMQVGVQALRQFGPTQLTGAMLTGLLGGGPESATAVAQGRARIRTLPMCPLAPASSNLSS